MHDTDITREEWDQMRPMAVEVVAGVARFRLLDEAGRPSGAVPIVMEDVAVQVDASPTDMDRAALFPCSYLFKAVESPFRRTTKAERAEAKHWLALQRRQDREYRDRWGFPKWVPGAEPWRLGVAQAARARSGIEPSRHISRNRNR